MFRFFSRRLHGERGFTLIELLIVVAIIAILAAILIPNFLRARAQAQVSATKGSMKNTATALESYFVDNNGYPATGALGNLQPSYIKVIPADSCLPSGANGFLYSATSNNTDYVLYTSTWATAQCGQIAVGVSYTPGKGLTSY